MPPSSLQSARGVRDVLPPERATWDLVERAARRVARGFGYQEIEVPIIEPLELVERGIGGDTDVVSKEIYLVHSRAEPDSRLVLRPEATAGVVRAYFQNRLDAEPQPQRLYTLGPMFRHDRPQAGRYREFHQFDLEAFGSGAAALDAEVIEVAVSWLAALGVRGFTVELNSIGDAACRPRYLERLRAYYRPLRERLDPECQRRLEVNPLRLLDCKAPQCQPLKANAPRIADHLCPACQEAFSEVRRLLDAGGIEYRLNPYLVRGLDYYTRTVFEVSHEALGGAQSSLGGGGRYDGLAAALGYADTPATGFAAGLERVILVLERQRLAPPPSPPAELAVLPDGEGLAGAAASVGRIARRSVRVAVDYSTRSLRAKMRAAHRAGYPWVAIMNSAEANREVVQLRHMASGDQREVAWRDLPDVLRAPRGGASPEAPTPALDPAARDGGVEA
ncbi:MAG TPA: histidine--tRNA ligase [Candidatus Dormibacteraeota bacterium]|nr:histidine--tRNA ligase [Candidatus Dormibacteraeota bacterium]